MSAAADGAAAISRLSREAAALTAKPIAGIKTVPGPDTNPLEWKMQVTAPAKYKPGGAAERDSPYAGRVFEVTIKFPTTYPFKVPDLFFVPGQVYHPGIARETGEICSLSLREAWGPTKSVKDLANFVLKLLEDPKGASPLDAEAAAEMDADISKFETNARKKAEAAPKA